MAELRAVVVMDYQNVHLTGRGLFFISRHRPVHESLVDPLYFANQLITIRNSRQREGMDHAVLAQVLVYRGDPSVEHDPKPYARNQAQKAHWQRDPRVIVTLRPLKYRYEYTEDGRCATDSTGRRIVKGKDEKGVDVLCALALVREARNPNIDLVILASSDSDLVPALDEALAQGTAKVETVSWYDKAQPGRISQLRPSAGRRIWHTQLGETEFSNSWDRTQY